MAVLPYKNDGTGKKQQVARMFDNISRRYDFLNHFLSLGIDKGWRKKAVKTLVPLQPRFILDVATGTGDFALTALSLNPEKITGIDISDGMLAEGRKKIIRKNKHDKIVMLNGDSENLPFEDQPGAWPCRNFARIAPGRHAGGTRIFKAAKVSFQAIV